MSPWDVPASRERDTAATLSPPLGWHCGSRGKIPLWVQRENPTVDREGITLWVQREVGNSN